MRLVLLPIILLNCLLLQNANAEQTKRAANTVPDPKLAKQLGADERGMRNYILVILKTGPQRVPDGKERDEIFKGHFANMQKLSDAGKLVLAGPFSDRKDGWRGLFVFAVESVAEAEKLVATDPVIIKGEMAAEYHQWYGSAALMNVKDVHKQISPK